MTFQSGIVLVLTALCVLYFLKDFIRSAVGGGCGSGCGSCKSGGCPVKKLEAIQTDLDPPKHSA
jgi:hypothetical protein